MTPSAARLATFLGPDPLPALGSRLGALCADGCGLEPGAGPSWESFGGPGLSSSLELLRLPSVQERIRQRPTAILVWKGSAELERLAQTLGATLANSSSLISRRLENKRYFSEHAGEAGLPIPPTRSGTAGPDLLGLARELDLPLVFQLAHGFSGSRTYRLTTHEQLQALTEQFPGRACRVSTEVPGTPVTVTGVVSQKRVLVGAPSLQLTGIPELTPHPLGSCGNDHLATVPAADLVLDLTRRCGEWLIREGHLGVFGLDLVVGSDGSAWCLEVNPRLVASVPLFSLSARDHALPGILEHHLASFGIGAAPGGELPCDWSQVILYQRGDRRADPGWATCTGELTQLGEFRRVGQLGLGGPHPGQVGLLVQAHSRPGRELARLFFQGPALGADGSLLPHLRRVAAALRAELELPDRGESVS
ncbi:MAG: hypothetical protein ACREN1_08985 [Candidatus Dormibacteria bacterium]